jgi:hypothetical protein
MDADVDADDDANMGGDVGADVDEDIDAREEEYEGLLLLSLRRASSPAGERVCVVVAGAELLVLPSPGLLVVFRVNGLELRAKGFGFRV